ncbi:hypothetical protein GCM10007939_10580 [Amylibacter marinus]|uniref:Uncharacterized protein n=1 Tax=Amylibacter marinus TaxID=1475483 RepID=A0ABQ5VTL1_9RHOB|nr:DUF5333 domain-containing protein [Amylibacter marinus]GLQ34775.1 hypothetical protein GCM10007939_10580 [Amylibacter marinus]
MRIVTISALILALGTASVARPASLWDVPEVDRGLFQIGVAHGVRKNCNTIEAHKLRGASFAWKLVGHARDAGYSMSETRAFIEDKDEKAVLRARVVKYLQSKGLDTETPNALCQFGEAEIAKKSQVGVLLRMN